MKRTALKDEQGIRNNIGTAAKHTETIIKSELKDIQYDDNKNGKDNQMA